jgi:hypothetical protein
MAHEGRRVALKPAQQQQQTQQTGIEWAQGTTSSDASVQSTSKHTVHTDKQGLRTYVSSMSMLVDPDK